MLSQERLQELLKYDPDTGIFHWIPKPRSFRRNYKAGGRMLNGYITIGIDRKHYLAHRLAFLYMEGTFPNGFVDHIDTDRANNRWNNLRKASPSENNCNRVRGELPLGVYEITRKNRPGIWYATKIQKNGKQYSSYFRKVEDAIKWRLRKEEELFGEFQNKNYL
jgi:hypothetical protein